MKRIRRSIGNAEMMVALAVGWFMVFCMPFRFVTGLLGRVGAPEAGPPLGQDYQRARSVIRRLARIAERMPWRTTCLVQAIAGLLLLRRRRIYATVRLGVAQKDGALAAHAWLMVDAQVVFGEDLAAEFQPLADFGGKS